MKTYQVSLTVSDIEAEDEADAIKNFDSLVALHKFCEDSYEVEAEVCNDCGGEASSNHVCINKKT